MKKSNSKFAAVVFGIAIALTSCKPENTGNIDVRDDFTGNWLCNETSALHSTSNYTVTISKSTADSSKILLANLYNLGNSFKTTATINGHSLSLPLQTVNNVNISGSGSLSGSTITIHFTANDGSDTDDVTASLTH